MLYIPWNNVVFLCRLGVVSIRWNLYFSNHQLGRSWNLEAVQGFNIACERDLVIKDKRGRLAQSIDINLLYEKVIEFLQVNYSAMYNLYDLSEFSWKETKSYIFKLFLFVFKIKLHEEKKHQEILRHIYIPTPQRALILY